MSWFGVCKLSDTCGRAIVEKAGETEKMKSPKVLALYLPQFHRVKENDEWWGEGFTEWSAVKAAKPLYLGHEQPKRPLEYYDLLDKATMHKQAEYMHRYGVDGMCFYHYYFENGKKILEKPAENLLRWTDIDMPFCFYWANESWVRSWSNISGNGWSEAFEPEMNRNVKSVLLRQDYGGRKEWEEHFYYLLPFFKDSRYIKKDGHPIFIFYAVNDILHLQEMIECWNELMEIEHLPSLFFIGRGERQGILDGKLIQPPADVLETSREEIYQNMHGLHLFLGYDNVWEKILRQSYNQKNVFLCGLVNFDSTPRRGRSGDVIYGGNPEKFKEYMIRLLLKTGRMESEYIFINAWNEWGEGMYLEPDEKWGFKYLEALKEAREFVNKYGNMVEASWSDNSLKMADSSDNLSFSDKRIERYRGYWMILSRWLDINLHGKSICTYLEQKSLRNVVVYGLGLLGKPLVHEMQNCGIRIAYGIDQDEYKGKSFDFPVYQLHDELPDADIIIVTVEYMLYNIKQQLAEKNMNKIITVSELLDFAEKNL